MLLCVRSRGSGGDGIATTTIISVICREKQNPTTTSHGVFWSGVTSPKLAVTASDAMNRSVFVSLSEPLLFL